VGEARGEQTTLVYGRGCSCLAVTSGACRGASSARSRIMPPQGGFLSGKSEILWASGGFSRVLAGPHGRAASVALGCTGQLACWQWDRTEGGERREKVMGLKRKKQKQQGPG
jgi:hypothetical protein